MPAGLDWFSLVSAFRSSSPPSPLRRWHAKRRVPRKVLQPEYSFQEVYILRTGGDDDQCQIGHGDHAAGDELTPAPKSGLCPHESGEARDDKQEVATRCDYCD